MKPLHDALESCLSALRSGADLDACLGMYPDLAESLRPALEAAQAAMGLTSEEIPAAAGIRARSTLLAKARTLSPSGRRRRMAAQAPRFAFALLAALLAVFLGGGGLLVASAAALPGDPLYGVKRTAEEVRLRLAPSSVRAGLEEEFNDRRASEIGALLSLGRVTPVAFEGVVSGQTVNMWVVGGLQVHLDPQTEVEGLVTIGRTAEVRGETQPDGEVRAREILLRGFEFTGAVEEIDDREWSVGGETFELTPLTRIDPAIVVGARVSVDVRVDDSGHFTARSFALLQLPQPSSTPAPTAEPTGEPSEEPEEVEFTGRIESMIGTIWVIGGRQVVIGPETRIDGDPQIGDIVRVEAVQQVGGPILAERVRQEENAETPEPDGTEGPTPEANETAEEGDNGEQVEFEGEVESIASGAWVIAGQTVIVTPQSEIDGDPAVGDSVRVRALRQADGSLVAERIERRD